MNLRYLKIAVMKTKKTSRICCLHLKLFYFFSSVIRDIYNSVTVVYDNF